MSGCGAGATGGGARVAQVMVEVKHALRCGGPTCRRRWDLWRGLLTPLGIDVDGALCRCYDAAVAAWRFCQPPPPTGECPRGL